MIYQPSLKASAVPRKDGLRVRFSPMAPRVFTWLSLLAGAGSIPVMRLITERLTLACATVLKTAGCESLEGSIPSRSASEFSVAAITPAFQAGNRSPILRSRTTEGSSNGRTGAFETPYLGSNPRPSASHASDNG